MALATGVSFVPGTHAVANPCLRGLRRSATWTLAAGRVNRLLQGAGYPIEDIAEETDRIQCRSFDQAARLADATGDNAAVREYLGLPKADPGFPPVPLIPAPEPDPAAMRAEE